MTLQSITNPGGTTQQTTQVITIYQRTLLEPIPDILPTLGFADLYPIPKNSGQTISLRRQERFSGKPTPLTEGTTPSPTNLTITEITATVSQHGDYVEWTDWFDLTSININVMTVMEEQGRQAALSLHQRALSIYVAGTNVRYVSTFSARNQITAGTYINKALLDDAIMDMSNLGVPPITEWVSPVMFSANGAAKVVAAKPCYVCVTTPKQWRRIKEITDVEAIEKYRGDGSGVFPSELGKYDKLRFIETTDVSNLEFAGAGAAGANVGVSLIFGKGAFGSSRITGAELIPCLVPANSPSQSDPLGQKGSVGWKATFSAVRLNESKLRRIEAAI